MLVVKQTQMPLSTEELLKTIESNKSTVMFDYRGHPAEQILRNSTGEQARFKVALEKYAPVPSLLLISLSRGREAGFYKNVLIVLYVQGRA
jgi:hypothetical protein